MSSINGSAVNGAVRSKQINGANGYKDQVEPHAVAAEIPATKEAGLSELIICVSGIYASLYVY